MPIGARVFAYSRGLHPDVSSLNDRVIAAGGSMTTTVLQAFNTFVIWCYVNGLRDGSNHIIKWLWVPMTQGFSGSLEKLWYPSGTASAMTNSGFASGNYGQDTGLTGTGSVYLGTGFTPSARLSADQNAHFALYSRTFTAQSDAHGVIIPGARLLLQPNWSNSTDGDYLNKRASFGALSPGGLYLINSLSSTSLKFWHRGTQRANTTSAASGSNSNINLEMFLFASNSSTGAANYSTRSISGASIGSAISESLIPGYNTQWQTLLAAVNASRPV